MKCSRAKRLISDYIDKNLANRQARKLEEHLKDCLSCREILHDFQNIRDSAHELENLIPSDQTWLAIQVKLAAARQKIRFSHAEESWFLRLLYQPQLRFILGSIFIVALIIVAMMVGIHSWRQKELSEMNNVQQFTMAKLDEAESHYQMALKALMEALSAQEKTMNPQVAEVFKKNLDIIDASIRSCRQAVLQNPDNINNRSFLLAAYRKKVDFLDEILMAKKSNSL